jgi:two-component system sensor histidine kinase CreC
LGAARRSARKPLTMRLGLRVFFGFFLIAGLSAVLLLKVFLAEVKPSVREVMEDLMVETAHLLAEVAADEMAAGAPAAHGRLAAQLQRYVKRDVDVMIWGVRKQRLDLRIYVTDVNGRVVLDSATPSAVGQDYSQWNDVARTLRGDYGARASPYRTGDDRSTVLVVAAPVLRDGRTLGVVSVAKPVASVQGFIDRAERRVFWAGAALLAASLIVGVAVTLWLVATVRRLRRYAQQVQAGQTLAPPNVPGELGDLAHAMDDMRRRLEGRQQLEHDVRALTHELKSPLAALRASGELLQDELPEADRRRFAAQVLDQTARLQMLVERVLALSQLEAQSGPGERQRLMLADWADAQLERQAPRLAQQGLRVSWSERTDVAVQADPALLELAFGNLLVNAIDFAPTGSTLELAVSATSTTARLTLRDHGPGVPAAGFAQLGKRFFSTARPGSLVKGSGLGLAIARRVMELHGGRLAFEAVEPGLKVSLVLPH